MAVHKVIEIIAESPKSFEDAVQRAVLDAAQTVKGIKSVWVKDISADVNAKGKIKSYRANCKITFEVK